MVRYFLRGKNLSIIGGLHQFKPLAVGSRDIFSQADEKITVAKAERIKKRQLFIVKMTTFDLVDKRKLAFCEFVQVWQQLLGSQLEINHGIQEPTAWTDVDHHKKLLNEIILFLNIFKVVCPGDPRDHLEDFVKIGEGSTGIVCIAKDKNTRYIYIQLGLGGLLSFHLRDTKVATFLSLICT